MFTRVGLRALSTEAIQIVNNVAKQQFTTSLQGVEASVSYETKGNIIIFNRTDVPSKLQGKGVGKLLAQHAFDYALDNKLEVIVKCSFIAKFYQRHLEKYKTLKVKVDED